LPTLFTTANRAVCITFCRIFGVPQDVQTLDQLNCAKGKLSIPAYFGGLNVPSLEVDAELAQYASFTTTLANVITLYESESLSPMYGLIRQELLNVATSTLPWAVQLRSSYDTISTMGGFSESDLVVLNNTLMKDISDYAGPDDELVVSPVHNAVAPATQWICLQLHPTPDALIRSGDSGGHIQRGVSRMLRARAYLDVLAFCRPYSPPDIMRVISGTCCGALVIVFALHEFSFKVPSNCYTMATHHVLGFTAERAFHVRKCPRCNEAPASQYRRYGSSSTVSGNPMSSERSTIAVLIMDHIPRCPCSWYVIKIGLSTCMKGS
jgi:hypothetical protein